MLLLQIAPIDPPDILFAIEQQSVGCLNHPDMMGIQNSIHALELILSFEILDFQGCSRYRMTLIKALHITITVTAPLHQTTFLFCVFSDCLFNLFIFQ